MVCVSSSFCSLHHYEIDSSLRRVDRFCLRMDLSREIYALPMEHLHIRCRGTKRNRNEQGMSLDRSMEQFRTLLKRPGHQPDAKASLIVPTGDSCLSCDEFRRFLA